MKAVRVGRRHGQRWVQSTAGHYIDVTGVEPGCYTLVTEADPSETFVETARTDNTAQTTFYLGEDHVDPDGC